MSTGASTGELWLTTILRPAGAMSGADAEHFGTLLRAASASSQVVMVDLRGIGPLPRPVRRALEAADAELTRSGGALVVLDPDERQHLPEGLLRRPLPRR
jgi:hypothetical protein